MTHRVPGLLCYSLYRPPLLRRAVARPVLLRPRPTQDAPCFMCKEQRVSQWVAGEQPGGRGEVSQTDQRIRPDGLSFA